MTSSAMTASVSTLPTYRALIWRRGCGEGVDSLPEEYPQSETGDETLMCFGTLCSGTLTLRGATLELSMVLSLCPRWPISLDPMEMSTPEEARLRLTSVAQVVKPAWNLSRSRAGFKLNICC